MHLNYINKSAELLFSFPEHKHPFWEMLLTLEGTGVQLVDGNEYCFLPGSILLIPPEIPHQTRSEQGYREFSISFYDFMPIGNGYILQLKDDEQQHARFLAEWILETVRASDSGTPSLTDALIQTLYQLLVSLSRIPVGFSTEILRLQALLSAHLDDADFDVGAAMDATGYSRGYLRRIFRTSVGMAPLAWLNHRRIDAAKQLFRQYPEVLSVRQIGAMTGFSDPYYFSKLFRKYTGLSPSDYRQRFLENPGHEVEIPENYR